MERIFKISKQHQNQVVLQMRSSDLFSFNISKNFLQVCSLPNQINQWTCFSKFLGRYLNETEDLSKLICNSLIIDISENANSKSQNQERIISNNQQGIYFCQQHPNCPIQFICTEQHNCQRRICAECQHDQTHYELNNKSFLPLDHFKEKIKQQASEILSQKGNCQILQKEFKEIEMKIQESILQKKKCYEQAIQNYNDQFQIATELLKTLEEQSILDNSNSVLEEMVKIYSRGLLKMQGSFNDINFNTIQDNLINFRSIVDSFQKQIENLNFIFISQQECQVIKIQNATSVIYQGKSLTNQKDPYKGKYLVSLSSLQIELYNNFQLLQTLTYDIKSNTTLRDIGQFVKEKIKGNQQFNRIMPDDIENWIYHSNNKNQDLTDFDKSLYRFIRTDVIKININSSSIVLPRMSCQMINLEILIHLQNSQKVLRQSFSLQTTLQQLEEAVYEFCGMSKFQNQVVDIYIFGQIYKNETKREKTLAQLQIQSGSQIEAKTRFISQSQDMNISQSMQRIGSYRPIMTIRLVLEIQDGPVKRSFTKEFQLDDTVQCLAKVLSDCCNLSDEFASVDIQIFGQPYCSEQKRNMTIQQLNLQQNQVIQGKIRWIGG